MKEGTFAKHADIVEQKEHPQREKNLRQINKTIEENLQTAGTKKTHKKNAHQKTTSTQRDGECNLLLVERVWLVREIPEGC